MKRLAPLFVLTAACGGAMSSVEMKGPDPDLAALAGRWQGAYQGQETGRTGKIQFQLELGRHTADGHVFMGPASTPLNISFVTVDKDTVRGRIDPYTDPSCSCEVETQFLGMVAGNEIDGTFTTKVKDTVTHGVWKVARMATDGT